MAATATSLVMSGCAKDLQPTRRCLLAAHVPPYTFLYLHMFLVPPYAFRYLHVFLVPPYAFLYLYVFLVPPCAPHVPPCVS